MRNKNQPTKIVLLIFRSFIESINVKDSIVILYILYTSTPVYIQPNWLYRSHRPGILPLTIAVLRSVVDSPTPKHFGSITHCLTLQNRTCVVHNNARPLSNLEKAEPAAYIDNFLPGDTLLSFSLRYRESV